MAASNDNPLLDRSGLPKFQSIKPEYVKPAMTDLLASTKADFKALENKVTETPTADIYSVVIEESEIVQYPLDYAWSVIRHLVGVKNGDELREAHKEMQPEVTTINQSMGQSRPLYKALEKLSADEAEWDKLEEAQQRIVAAKLRSMKLSGVGLEGDELEEFNKIGVELAALSTKFNNHVLDSTKAFTLTLTAKEEVDGLPPTALALAAKTAKDKGHEGATAEEGPWALTLDIPSYMPTMRHLKSSGIREKVYRAKRTIASTGDHDNVLVILRTLELKARQALPQPLLYP